MKKIAAIILAIALCMIALTAWAEEDGQNPVMNIIGYYSDETSQRASMNILCEGTDSAVVTIDWASSAFENTEWVFSGVFDTETNTIAYDNCVCTDQVFAEEESESVVYENGTGKLIVNEDRSISWINDMDENCSECLFVYVGAPIVDSEAETFEEDGQNPVMNLVGPYTDETSGRASMMIECEGANGALITIDWADSASVNTEWIIHGIYDTESNTIAYENCMKLTETYAEDGTLENEEVIYTDGSGVLTVNEDYSISWTNDAEETGNDCRFIFG